MDYNFFVILNTQRGGVTPMTIGDDDELALFKTEEEAAYAADANMLGRAFGFEIFERGTGTSG